MSCQRLDHPQRGGGSILQACEPRWKGRAHRLGVAIEKSGAHRLEEPVLVTEMPVQCGLGDAKLCGDIGEAHLPVGFASPDPERGLYDIVMCHIVSDRSLTYRRNSCMSRMGGLE
jgi:hypothetical protein